MVVDDDPSILQLLELVMKRGGYAVMTVRDADRALNLLENTTPDLFLLDVMMAGVNGVDLCKRIRARHQTVYTPILMSSADGSVMNIERCLAAGANEFLPKPINPTDLLKKVKIYVDGEIDMTAKAC